MTTEKKHPEATLRDGTLKATIWKNSGEKGDFYKIDLIRSYKDQNDQWKETSRFSDHDLLRVANLSQRAYNKILQLKAAASEVRT